MKGRGTSHGRTAGFNLVDNWILLALRGRQLQLGTGRMNSMTRVYHRVLHHRQLGSPGTDLQLDASCEAAAFVIVTNRLTVLRWLNLPTRFVFLSY